MPLGFRSFVLYSGRFEVLWHQRYYDWKEEQVGELLFDLKDAVDNGKSCYTKPTIK